MFSAHLVFIIWFLMAPYITPKLFFLQPWWFPSHLLSLFLLHVRFFCVVLKYFVVSKEFYPFFISCFFRSPGIFGVFGLIATMLWCELSRFFLRFSILPVFFPEFGNVPSSLITVNIIVTMINKVFNALAESKYFLSFRLLLFLLWGPHERQNHLMENSFILVD